MDQNIYKLVYKVTHAGGSGSCFYLKSYNLFVTNYHVVNGFHTVAIHDNDRNPYLAKVVLVNPSLDIALLAVDADFSALPELSLAADDSLAIGGKVRTFIQTALGYVITNVTLALGGLDFNDGDVVKNALIGLAVAAVAAGASAVMNLKEGEDKDNE